MNSRQAPQRDKRQTSLRPTLLADGHMGGSNRFYLDSPDSSG